MDAPAIVVPDVLETLNVLTSWMARKLPGTTRIGVTGSSGKTSTKDLLAQVLGRLEGDRGDGGSQNNEISVR